MPNVTLHLVLADRALEHWRARPGLAPFDLDDPGSLNAFFHGAFGPDLGYFPGGHPFFSDLAHTVATGDLTRALVRLAETDRERAFAWGWVTHVLGDVAIHPLVGLGVGELLHGDSDHFVAAADDKVAHVRVEVGLDAWFSAREPELRRRVLGPAFDGNSVEYLARAYAETYQVLLDPRLLLASHHTTVRMSLRALATIGVLSQLLAQQNPPPALLGLSSLMDGAVKAHAAMGLESMLIPFLSPVAPSAWLVDRVLGVVDGLPGELDAIQSGGLADYPNYNLDTGTVEEPAHHSVTVATLDRLARLRGGLGMSDARDAAYPGRVRYPGGPARVG